MSQRVIVLGIDEAGYGPVLGPLVVSAVAFEVPAELVESSLWGVLRGSVSSAPKPRDRRVAICDSKKLYQRKEGISRLERSALASMLAWRDGAASVGELLGMLWPDGVKSCAAYPWYRELGMSLPLAADGGGVRIAASRLRLDAEAKGLSVAGLFCEPLLEGHYNRLVSNTRNKAVVLFGQVTRLIQRVADAFPGRELHIFVDRQGGRDYYGQLLMRAFEDRRLAVIEETETTSAYELRAEPAAWRVRFTVAGESKHLPVALASIVSKYVRELFMLAFNRYWQSHAPDVAATAGYYRDGMRFIEQIQQHMLRLGVERQQLVRMQ